jgi:glutamate--cysteine ligase
MIRTAMKDKTMVPHLTTALTGPLLDLERCFLENETTVER